MKLSTEAQGYLDKFRSLEESIAINSIAYRKCKVADVNPVLRYPIVSSKLLSTEFSYFFKTWNPENRKVDTQLDNVATNIKDISRLHALKVGKKDFNSDIHYSMSNYTFLVSGDIHSYVIDGLEATKNKWYTAITNPIGFFTGRHLEKSITRTLDTTLDVIRTSTETAFYDIHRMCMSNSSETLQAVQRKLQCELDNRSEFPIQSLLLEYRILIDIDTFGFGDDAVVIPTKLKFIVDNLNAMGVYCKAIPVINHVTRNLEDIGFREYAIVIPSFCINYIWHHSCVHSVPKTFSNIHDYSAVSKNFKNRFDYDIYSDTEELLECRKWLNSKDIVIADAYQHVVTD